MQHLQPNTTLQSGKYRIDRVLGQGGFGITYMAIQVSANCQVAIKELFLNGVNERAGNSIRVSNSVNDSLFEKQKEKFKKEAMRIMSLDNEHIVKVYDLFEENNTVYYVMDYVDGETLYDLMKRNDSPMTELEVKRLLPQILDALKSIHNASILYLDLKPMNIMINKSGKMILVDFEASKQFNLNNFSKVDEEEMSYTPYYSPREQIELDLDNIGPWSDIYALGATLFNLLTNKRPPSPSDIDSDESDDKHVSLPLFNISRGMKHFILLMMKTNWTQRPQTIDELSLMMQNELYGIDNQNKNMQHLQPNTTLQGGKYRIIRMLGQGNFGITYLAQQHNTNRTVAIKELFLSVQGVNDRLGSSVIVPNIRNKQMFEQQISKFKKEAKRIMSLHNEHIVPVYDLFDENDTAYYVMEYVEGESLADKMNEMGHPFSVEEVQNIFPQILDALIEIHSHQILHLDIKPSNIMIDGDGLVKLIDFGASKQLSSEETAMTGFYFTRGYAPSEQTGMLFSKFGPWTDIYAVGATMYNLLTSKSPTQFDIEEFNPNEIPEDDLGLMYLLIDWMMQPKRQDRPQQAVDVKQRYYIELVKIGILSIFSERLDRQVTKTIGEDIDLQTDLHASKTQCNAIQKDIEETFGVDVSDVPLTFDYLVVAVLTSLGLYVLDEENRDDEDTIFDAPHYQETFIPQHVSVNGHVAVDLGLSVLWATMDVGALNEDSYGECYLWGDPDGEKTRKVLNSFLARWFKGGPSKNKICGDYQYDTATNQWGTAWRMPTCKEFEELATQCTWELVDNNHARLTGPNGNSIVLDNRYHWTGESPFGNIVMFSWNHDNGDIRWGLPSIQNMGKDYTDLFFPVRAVANK